MTTGSARALDPLGSGVAPATARPRAGVRRWAWAGLVAQVFFVVMMLVAASWQGPRYSVVAHTISDMTAVTAPGGTFLVVVFTLCGAATIGFTLWSVWPVLRPAGWTAAAGSILLALSIVGLGNLLSAGERLACRMADPGCTATGQLANTGGKLDNAVSSLGVIVLVLAGFFLAAAMRRTPGWRTWATPTRWITVLVLASAVASVLTQDSGQTGLFERLVAVLGAGALAVLAGRILRRA